MTALRRQRFQLYLKIVAVGALIGVLYSAAVGPSAGDWITGVAYGGTLAASIGFIEMFLFNTARLATLPFAAVLLLKTLAFGVIVTAVLTRGGTTDPGMLPIAFSLIVTAIFVTVMQGAQLLGLRTARDLVLGRYRRPRRERRFFLFVDVAGSTGIAERLGPLDAHRFLAAVFAACAEPVAACNGEIAQFVGDEVVVTWTEAEGALEARPVRCFFLIEDALEKQKPRFLNEFRAEPRLRAALHFGEVIAGEVGVWRRAIVFHGDVMNTASRLENATRELGLRFIASHEALEALGKPALAQVAACRDLGQLPLRGRKEPIHAWGVEPAG